MLRPQNSSSHWIRQADVVQSSQEQTKAICWHRRESVPRVSLVDNATASLVTSPTVRKEDTFKTNLLSKIPINSTIIGSNMNAMSTSLMSRSGLDATTKTDGQLLPESSSSNDLTASVAVPVATSARSLLKTVYNRTIDAFVLSDHCKGFLKEKAIADTSGISWPVFGVYCIRWRRTGSSAENESKFVIQGIGEWGGKMLFS